ncbi:MAG: hypothetical protein ACE5KV_06415, partial [Thermoplasmata archaeon]
MMLSKGRRITLDREARVPFAVLAVTIFLLSSFSTAYLGAITRVEIANSLQRRELIAMDEIGRKLEKELQLEAYLIGTRSILMLLEESNSQTNAGSSIEHEAANSLFQDLLSDYLSQRFPADIGRYHVEEKGHSILLLPKVANTYDFVMVDSVPSQNIGDYERKNFSKVDTRGGGKYKQTNNTCYYLVTGFANISVVSSWSRISLNKTLKVKREIKVPLPFLTAKLESFQSRSVGSLSELSRLVEYILTTIAQYKVFQGVGMKGTSLPPEILEELHIDDTSATDVLTVKDVELAVNLAFLLETAREFRRWDSRIPGEIDSRAGAWVDIPGQYPPVEDLSGLLSYYAMEGSIDASDLITLYLGLGREGAQGLNLELIFAQAIYGVLDQFVLKYLDYFGVMPLSNEIWRGIQSVDGVLQLAGESIQDIWAWFKEASSTSWREILEDWLRQKLILTG